MTVATELNTIDEGYEYLMAYASYSQETGDMEATEYIEDVRETLEALVPVLEERAKTGDDHLRAFFEWTVDQTQLTIAVLTLFLENTETTPERVNALLSAPPFRNCLTTIMYLTEINELNTALGD